jgi:hypothetical protein
MDKPVKCRGIVWNLIGGMQYPISKEKVMCVLKFILQQHLQENNAQRRQWPHGSSMWFPCLESEREIKFNSFTTEVTFCFPLWFLLILYYLTCTFSMGNTNSQHNSSATHLSLLFYFFFSINYIDFFFSTRG